MAKQVEQIASLANSIVQLLAAADDLRLQINAMSSQFTNLSAANKLNAFPTAALLASGDLGTPDGSPVVTNPINTGVYPGSLVSVSVSATQLAGMVTGLQGIASVINGGSVAANGALASLIALTK